MMAKHRSGIAFIIAAVVLVIVCLTVPPMVYKPHGVFLPSLTYHPYPPKKAANVRWLLYPPAWGSYPQVGTVSFEYHDPEGLPEKRKELVQAMKAAAAKAGGNAVVKQQLFSSVGYGPSAQAIWFGKGVVIFAPQAP